MTVLNKAELCSKYCKIRYHSWYTWLVTDLVQSDNVYNNTYNNISFKSLQKICCSMHTCTFFFFGGEDVCFQSLKNQLIKVLASAWTGMKRSFSLILMFNSPLLYGKVAKVGPCNVKAFCWEWPVALFIHWLTGRWGNILILPVPSTLYLLALLPVLSQVWAELLLVNKFC